MRSRLARSRSNRLTATMRGRLSAAASAHSFSVWTSTPETASTATTAASTTRRAERASVRKLANPGVSMMLILVFCHSAWARLAARVCLRAMDSSSKSVDGRAVVNLAEAVDGAGAEQHRRHELGLAASAVADDGHVADVSGVVHLHTGNPPACSPRSPISGRGLRIIVPGERGPQGGFDDARAEMSARDHDPDIYVSSDLSLDKYV